MTSISRARRGADIIYRGFEEFHESFWALVKDAYSTAILGSDDFELAQTRPYRLSTFSDRS